MTQEQMDRLVADRPAGMSEEQVRAAIQRQGYVLPAAAPMSTPAPQPRRPNAAMADFGRLTSVGGIGGMGGIEENPGMGMLSPDQRSAVRSDALGNYGTQAALAMLFGGAGAAFRNPVARAAGGALVKRAPWPVGPTVRAASAARSAAARAATTEAGAAGAARATPKPRPAPRPKPKLVPKPAPAAKPKQDWKPRGASGPELARRTAARQAAVGRGPDLGAQLQNSVQGAQNTSGLSPEQRVTMMRILANPEQYPEAAMAIRKLFGM